MAPKAHDDAHDHVHAQPAPDELRRAAYGDLHDVETQAQRQRHSHDQQVDRLPDRLRRENQLLKDELRCAKRALRVAAKQRAVLLHNLCALLRTARREAARRLVLTPVPPQPSSPR
eukprot:gb/GEZJ01002720.1/.p4 GENE.gb/GEZJ01002720.1/~~gb/GEZJ01002720.1/.p4  ORF type:complete len:116 (-),score=22.94 gb/GEZJ01002720.1/:505-852(-)